MERRLVIFSQFSSTEFYELEYVHALCALCAFRWDLKPAPKYPPPETGIDSTYKVLKAANELSSAAQSSKLASVRVPQPHPQSQTCSGKQFSLAPFSASFFSVSFSAGFLAYSWHILDYFSFRSLQRYLLELGHSLSNIENTRQWRNYSKVLEVQIIFKLLKK